MAFLTPEEWNEIHRRSGELYKHMKRSGMPMDEYRRRCGDIYAPLLGSSIFCESLLRFRRELRKLGYDETTISRAVRHEGVHARIARKMAKKLGSSITVYYVIDLLDYGNGRTGAGWRVVFSNIEKLLKSRKKYAEFMNAVVSEHPNPSEGDKQYL